MFERPTALRRLPRLAEDRICRSCEAGNEVGREHPCECGDKDQTCGAVARICASACDQKAADQTREGNETEGSTEQRHQDQERDVEDAEGVGFYGLLLKVAEYSVLSRCQP